MIYKPIGGGRSPASAVATQWLPPPIGPAHVASVLDQMGLFGRGPSGHCAPPRAWKRQRAGSQGCFLQLSPARKESKKKCIVSPPSWPLTAMHKFSLRLSRNLTLGLRSRKENSKLSLRVNANKILSKVFSSRGHGVSFPLWGCGWALPGPTQGLGACCVRHASPAILPKHTQDLPLVTSSLSE